MDFNNFLLNLSELDKQAITIAKKCTILRASSAYNCQHITSLFNYLSNNENIKLDVSYSNSFNEIISIIDDFIVFLNKLTKEDPFNLIMTRCNEMLTFMEIFPRRLEMAAAELGINTKEAIPNTSKQKMINRRSDLYKMRALLQAWIHDKNNSESPMKDSVKSMIDSIMEIEGFKNEVEKKLSDLKRIDINDDIELDSKAADKHLGAGGFGTVCKATRKSTAEFVAVKEIRGDKLSPSSWSSLFAEIVNMNKLHHPYVLELVGAHTTEPYRIITRYCSGRSLFDRLHRKSALPVLTSKDLTKIAYQVASGMEYLHENKIVHRDLKTLNILLDGNGNACIADFGLSGIMKENESEAFGETVGTPHYTAPEVLAHTRYGQKVDVYSYAIVLWEMLTRLVPFSDKAPTSIYDHVVTCGWRLPFPTDAQEKEPELCKLITQCWAKDPNDRPDFSEIVDRFEDGTVKFPNSTPINYETLKKEIHCPPLNVAYALSVMKDINHKYFGSVTRFIAERIDQKIADELNKENILSYMLKSEDNIDSILLLASKLIKEEDGFCEFLDNGGLKMIKKTISDGVLNGALKFGIAVPKKLNMYLEQFIPQIIKCLNNNNDENKDDLMLTIFKFMIKFPNEKIAAYSEEICEALPKAAMIFASPKNPLAVEENYKAVVDLFIICHEGLRDVDVTVFYPLISDRFAVKQEFVKVLRDISKEENYALFVLQILKALKKTDLAHFLNEFLKSRENDKSDLFRKLSELPTCYETLTSILRNPRLKARRISALLVFFEIAQIKEAAIKIARSELLSALFDSSIPYNEQRLQILTALTQNEEFCEETNEMDNIIHLLASDLNNEDYRDCTIRLILAMSAHKKGCEILANDGVLLPFAQLFLSSLSDSSSAYTILRNAANFKAQIPQAPLIVSCLMQVVVFEMSHKNEILDTLIALVENMQGSVQEADLRTIILPQLKRETPQVVYRCLKLFSVCDPNKLSPQTVKELLSAINEIFNSKNMMYPCIISTAVKVLSNLTPKNLQSFFISTDITNFLQETVKMFKKTDNTEIIDAFIEKEKSIPKFDFPQKRPRQNSIKKNGLSKATPNAA